MDGSSQTAGEVVRTGSIGRDSRSRSRFGRIQSPGVAVAPSTPGRRPEEFWSWCDGCREQSPPNPVLCGKFSRNSPRSQRDWSGVAFLAEADDRTAGGVRGFASMPGPSVLRPARGSWSIRQPAAFALEWRVSQRTRPPVSPGLGVLHGWLPADSGEGLVAFWRIFSQM